MGAECLGSDRVHFVDRLLVLAWAMPRERDGEQVLAFGGFVVDPVNRMLLRDGRPVPLSSRAFDTLMVFLEHRGQVLNRDELIALIWPGLFVDENNLAQQVSALRKALGEDDRGRPFIETVPRRGYVFQAEVLAQENPAPSRLPSRPPVRPWRRGWALAAAVTLLGLAGFGFWRSREKPLPAALGLGLTFTNDEDFPALSRDGRRLAYVSGDPPAQRVWVRDLPEGTPRQVFALDAGSILGLVFQPDGEALCITCFAQGSTRLDRVPATGGSPVTLMRNLDSPVAFSPDGKRMAFRRVLPTDTVLLCLANADGSAERVLASRRYPAGFGWEGMDWSPDGLAIACPVSTPSPGNLDWSLSVFRVADGRETPLPGAPFLAAGQVVWSADGRGVYGLFRTPDVPGRQLWFMPLPGQGTAQPLTREHDHHGLGRSGPYLVTSEAVKHALIWKVPLGPKGAPPTPGPVCKDLDSAALGMACLPDGTLLMGTETPGGMEIVRVDANGAPSPVLPSPNGDRLPTVGREGHPLAFVSQRGGNANVWLQDGMQGLPRPLTRHIIVRSASITPDGSAVYYDAPMESSWAIWGIWRVGTDASSPQRVFTQGGRLPRVSPDGRWLGFNRWDEEQGCWRLAVMPTAGGEATVLPATAPQDSALAWTPDSHGLVFLDTREGVSNLYVQPLDKSPARPLTHFKEERIFRFALSPDGGSATCERGRINRNILRIEAVR